LHDRTFAPARLRIVPDMGHAFQPASIDEVVDSVAWVLEAARLPV
jgi:hypothetical protein